MPRQLDDYVEVNERIIAFYERFPEGSLQTDWPPQVIETPSGGTFLAVRALAYRTPDDPRPGTGSAWEPVPGKTNFTRDSELMNAETSAWGRAIAALGFEVKRGIASREEVQNRREEAPAQPQSNFRARTNGAPPPSNVKAPPELVAVIEQLLEDVGKPQIEGWFDWQGIDISGAKNLGAVALKAQEWLNREELGIPSLIASINEFEPADG